MRNIKKEKRIITDREVDKIVAKEKMSSKDVDILVEWVSLLILKERGVEYG